MISSGQLLNKLSVVHSESNFSGLASLFAMWIWKGVDFAPPSGITWATLFEQHPNLPKETHLKLRAFLGGATMEIVWDSREKALSARTLLDRIIRYMIESKDLGRVRTDIVTKNLSKYLRAVPWSLESKFVAELEKHNTFWDRLATNPINSELHTLAKHVSQISDENKNKVRSLILERLPQATKELWLGAIDSQAEPYNLATEFLPRDALNLGLKSGLSLALQGSAEAILSTNDRPKRLRWFKLTESLNTKARKLALSALTSKLMAGSQTTNLLGLLKAGGPAWRKDGGFAGHSDAAVDIIIEGLLSTKDGRAWLKSVEQEAKGWVAKASKEKRQNLSKKLTEFSKGANGERKYWAEGVQKAWGL